MPNNRFETLIQFIETNPNDCFARYGVAQEYLKQGEHGKALEHFTKIFETNPAYQAAYYHAGKAYEKLGRVEEALATYRKGIEVASGSGDLHALSELQAALNELSGQ
jgi:tetratricopeptide (TPR) repeat protein